MKNVSWGLTLANCGSKRQWLVHLCCRSCINQFCCLYLFRFRDTLWSEVDLIVANQEVKLHLVNQGWSGWFLFAFFFLFAFSKDCARWMISDHALYLIRWYVKLIKRFMKNWLVFLVKYSSRFLICNFGCDILLGVCQWISLVTVQVTLATFFVNLYSLENYVKAPKVVWPNLLPICLNLFVFCMKRPLSCST